MKVIKESYCSYCSALQTPFESNNFCSRHGHTNDKIFGNVFYIKTNQLVSEEHKSRISIRGVLNGYQHYYVDNRDLLLSKHKFVVFENEQAFSTKIESPYPTEAVIVSYGQEDLHAIINSFSSSFDDMLDGIPSTASIWDIKLFDSTYDMSKEMSIAMHDLAEAIQMNVKDELFYEEMRFTIMEKALRHLLTTEKKLLQLSIKKESTKIEHYRRLLRSKDYILSHLDQKLSLEEISTEASMSPYHYIRSFKGAFKLTPMQFVVQERLSLAKDLIQHTNLPISQILIEAGYDNPSSFSRAFKKKYGITPLSYRAA
ncbi:helix-turn-helix domain-containing protein [Flagellimonas zhangzhouensis]|uniref:Helix-turn-helix domain-containing protein n=1 Tax=Flagellimonas zhangzhouensis TaxID=1073328 RepID=A0A1H2XV99_9FLAO|nr:AraC family transcriptional regulator [Allomuricauda zhangzhouensis]SDQ91947.1 Helix-turn-helix domain-containing protein [Allomuricauda zhangzhouensis]SDW96675.1 Helix-turn-helix domain-containing protein [Allomuricauda zhangzhouensis]